MNDKLNHSYTAEVSLLAHGLSVKLSPCPCNHTHNSSCSNRTNGCVVSMCGHLHLLTQANPHNDVTLVSIGKQRNTRNTKGPSSPKETNHVLSTNHQQKELSAQIKVRPVNDTTSHWSQDCLMCSYARRYLLCLKLCWHDL